MDRSPPTAWIVSNPTASGGRVTGRSLAEAVGTLAQLGWSVQWRTTERPGHAEDIAREAAAAGADALFVAGGDGTINEATNGLVGTETALAILPAGTGNVMAGQLGLVRVPTPLHRPDPPAAARLLAVGSVRRVDVGVARPCGRPERCFLMWAGVGFDAAVARTLESGAREVKRKLGPAAYGAVGLTRILHMPATEAIVRAGALRSRGLLMQAIVANIALYAGTVALAPSARMDDAQLDLAVFLRRGTLSTLGDVGTVLAGRQNDTSSLQRERVTAVRIVAREPLPVHLDAEPYGTTPVRIRVLPRSLCLLTPPTAPDALFVR